MIQNVPAGKIHLFQIYYDAASHAALDAGFVPFANIAAPRPDWCEFTPIMKILGAGQFADNDYIGVFSPRFLEKTACSAADVRARVAARDAEIYSFSPYFDQSAWYLNPFEQGEANHPGLIAATRLFLHAIGSDIDLERLVADSGRTIFANYFVARFSFWKEWRRWAEKLYLLAEATDTPLGQALNAATVHRGGNGHALKVFLLERLPCLILTQNGTAARPMLDPRHAPLANPGLARHLRELLACDALKGQYLRTGRTEYLDGFFEHRHHLMANR